MYSIKFFKVLLISIVTSASLFSISNAAQLGLVVKYSDSGAGAGDLNQVGDQVNGRVICPSANTNANTVPGCDMSDNIGYNNNGTINDPSDDYYTGDLIIRTNDIFEFVAGWNWIKESDGAEQTTITCNLPAAQSVTRPGYKWAFLPGSCNSTLSSISSDGKTITCVRSNFDTNDVGTYAEDLPFGVQALGGNENGYEPGDIGCTITSSNATTKVDDTDSTSLLITASPRWNMQHVVYHYAPGQTFNGQTGWLMYFKQYIEVDEVYGSTDSVGGFLGNESLGSDATITYTQDMSQISPNAQLYDCDPDIGWINGGDPMNYYVAAYPDRSVATPENVQLMNCSSSGTGGVINVTIQHLDATLSHYAKYDWWGNALPVNRKIAAINMIRVFIPLDDVKNGEDGIFGTADDGQLITRGEITNFDPNGISGLSNFASTTENTGDNYQEHTLFYANGYWDKYYRGIYNADGTWYPWTYPYDIIDYRSGRGTITPGGVFYTEQNYSNNGGSDVTGVVLCDVFDANTYDTFADPSTNLNDSVWSHVPGTPMHLYNNFGDGTPYHYEYATTYETSWPPDPYTTHGDQVAQECAGTGTVRYTDYNIALSNGPITKARLVIDAPVKPNQTFLWWIGHKARSTDLSGNLLPGGTLLPNYASFSDSLNDRFGSFWKHNSYRPNSYTGAHIGGGGDRLILQRAKARITKSASPLDQDGNPTGGPASTPGLKIRYSLTGSFTTDGALNETSTVVIKDLLPAGIRYVAGSTQGGHGEPTISNNCSDVQDLVDQGYSCSSSNQILIWNLGSRTSNVTIPAVTFDAIVDVDVAEGTASNYALIESPVDQSKPVQRTANANTIISIPRSLLIVKGIEQGRNQFNIDGLSNWVKFTVNMRNGTPGSLTDLDMIDVFPFRGDNASGILFTVGTTTITTHRNPATSYTGQFEFVGGAINNIDNCTTGTTTWYYTDRIPSQIDLSPTATSNQSGGATTWCAGTENGPDGGCGFTKQQATAVRVVGAGMGSQGVCQVKLTFATDDNLGGDIYTNSAGAHAQGVSLPVLSNAVSALVYDYQIGDTVWFDNNQDGLIGSGEQLVSGAILSLYTNTGALIGTTTTNASGYYIFTGLMSGTYNVSLTPISGAIYGYDQDSTNRYSDGTTTLSLSGSSITSRMDIDFGLYELGSIAGVIYHDTDRGQSYASGDNSLSGMVVILSGTDFSGNIIYLTGLTNGQGAYLFDHLALGVYSVSYDDSSSLLADSVQRGTVSGSPVGTTSGVQQNTITLGYGNHVINNNFGLISPGSINGTVWYDMDANQTLDMSEVYVSGAKVIITYTNSIEGVVTTIAYTDAAGNWSVGDIQTGSTYTVDIDMSYGPTNGYKLTTNNITTNGFVSFGNTQHVSDHGLYLTNVMVSKSVNVSDATLGDTLTYTIAYQNTSSGTAYNVSIYDLFPFDFLQWVSSTSAPSIGSTNEVTPTTLGWSIGTLAPGQAGSISIQAMIYTGNEADIVQNLAAIDTTGTGYVTGNLVTVTTGSITTTGTTTETTTGDNLSSAQVRIYRVDLGIVKDVDRATIGPNDIFEYTLHISNNTGIVSNIVVQDDLDPDLIYVGMGSGLITSTPIISGQTFTWTGITLAPRATSTLKILVKPAQYLPDGITLNNTALVGRYNGSGQLIPLYELDSTNNVSSVKVTLSGTNYTSVAGHVYFDENSSSGFDAIDTYQGGVIVHLLSGGSVIATTSTNMSGYYYFGSLVAGTYEVQYEVPGGYHSYTSLGGQGASTNGLGNMNSAAVSETAITSIVLVDGNNSINNDFGFVRPYDLAVTKTADIGTGTSDTVVAYTITYANLGGYPVPDTVVDDIWPSTLMDFVSASITPSTSTASGSNTQYTWNLGTLSPYSSGTIVITGMIKQGLASGTVVENRAIIRSTTATGETNTLNNDSSTQRSTADTDLSIIKTTTSTTSIIDTLVTWIIDYNNAGPQTAYDVTVHDLIPSGLTYESSSITPNSRTATTGGEHLTWNIGSLLAGTSGQIIITTRTDTGVTHLAPYINAAVISGSTTERTLINNTSLAQVIAINKLPFDGYVWYDSDNSSTTGNVWSDIESHASGIVVEIYNMSGVLIDTLITNSSGMYYGSVLPGEYRTNIIIPTHYSLTTPNNTPFTIDVNSITSTHVDDDGLYHKPGTFEATVWYDDDSSQSRGTGELMVNGAPVQVYDSKNRLVGTYITDMQGVISGSLIPGVYTFKLVDITSYTTTTLQIVTYVIASETHHHVYDFGIARGQTPNPSTGAPSAPTLTPPPSQPTPEQPKPTPPKVHNSAPEQPKPIPPQETTTKPSFKLSLDHDITIKEIKTRPNLAPRTFVMPEKLLDTGTPEAQLKEKGIEVRRNPKIETQMADWIKPVAADVAATLTLDDWIAHIPQDIRDQINLDTVQQWIVVPNLGIVAPVDDIPEDTSDWSTLVNGGDIKINPYLKKGVVHYPLSVNAGEIGNMIIAGHSSYFKADDGLFKTIFTSLPLLNAGDEVIVYKKKTTEQYQQELEASTSSSKKSWDATTTVEPFTQFSYVIRNSYEISSFDTWILKSRPNTSHLTVFTCTPIGSNKNRWYIDAVLK